MKKFSKQKNNILFNIMFNKIVTTIILLFALTPLSSHATKEVYLYDNNKEVNLFGLNGPVPGQSVKCGIMFSSLDPNRYQPTINTAPDCYSLMNVATDFDITETYKAIANLNSELTTRINSVENSTNTKFKYYKTDIADAVAKEVEKALTTVKSSRGQATTTGEKLAEIIRAIIKEEIAKANE